VIVNFFHTGDENKNSLSTEHTSDVRWMHCAFFLAQPCPIRSRLAACGFFS